MASITYILNCMCTTTGCTSLVLCDKDTRRLSFT